MFTRNYRPTRPTRFGPGRHNFRVVTPPVVVVFFLAGLITANSPGLSQEVSSGPWISDVLTAQRRAAASGKLVLIHFWSSKCQPCRFMNDRVLTNPEVLRFLSERFEPVKVNVDQFPYTAKQYGVNAVPTCVIVSPTGEVLQRWVGATDSQRYLQQLAQVDEQWRARMAQAMPQPPATMAQAGSQIGGPPTVPTTAPGGIPAANLEQGLSGRPGTPIASFTPGSGPSGSAPQTGAVAPGQSYFSPSAPVGQGSGGLSAPAGASSQPATAQPSFSMPSVASQASLGGASAWPPTPPVAPQGNSPALAAEGPKPAPVPTQAPGQSEARNSAASQLGASQMASSATPAVPAGLSVGATAQQNAASGSPAGLPPLGLDGFCPVSLAEQGKWVPGDPQWGLIHEGRLYLFAGPSEQAKFAADPFRYAPVLSGYDVVLAVEKGVLVPGKREFGGWYEGRVYLFANEETLRRFDANPVRYTAALPATPSRPSAETLRLGTPHPARTSW